MTWWYRGGIEFYLYSFFNLGARLVRGSEGYAPAAASPPGKRHGAHCTEVWVGPRAGLDGYGKPHPHQYSIAGPFNPWLVAITSKLQSISIRPSSDIQFRHTLLLSRIFTFIQAATADSEAKL
jgi:hypothetical protein